MLLSSWPVVVASLMLPQILSAEEKSWSLRTADLVIVGKLNPSSYFLFFDGIHLNGSIVPTEVLYGAAQPGVTLRYSHVIECSAFDSILEWIRPNSPGCNYRAVWSGWSAYKRRILQQGVWELMRAPEGSWTGRRSDTGFRELDYRDYAVSVLAERKQQEQDH
jgi:hypothetical protein